MELASQLGLDLIERHHTRSTAIGNLEKLGRQIDAETIRSTIVGLFALRAVVIRLNP